MDSAPPPSQDPLASKRKRDDHAGLAMAETLSEFGIKMFQSGLKHQNDGFMRLNEVHRAQLQKLMDENLTLHKHNIELMMEITYLRRKAEEAKVLDALMSMRNSCGESSNSGGEDDEENHPPSAQEEEPTATTTTATASVDRPSFASIVAPSPPLGCSFQDLKKSAWMFQYEADRPIGASDLNKHSPLFKTTDTVRIGDGAKGVYVVLAQLHQRVACVKMTEVLQQLMASGAVREGSVAVEWAKHYGADAWLDIAAVEETKQCDSQAVILRYMRGWRKRGAVVCCDGHTIRFPFQRVKA